jgi:hypothetical protein
VTDVPLVDTPQGKIFDRRKECQQCHLLEKRIVVVEGAFPDGPEKHAAYHQAKINAAKEEADFWRTAKAEVTKNGVAAVFGVIKIIATVAALALMYKLGLGALAGQVIK